MKRWSKLQKEIEKLLVEDLDLKVQCRVYRKNTDRGPVELPRYWITLGEQVVWDYPRDFQHQARLYPHVNDVAEISNFIREYIDTPVDSLVSKAFEDDWHLGEVLLAADRRVGRRKVPLLNRHLQHAGARSVLEARWPRAAVDEES